MYYNNNLVNDLLNYLVLHKIDAYYFPIPISMALPNHIVFIPDGNRRWAKERGQPSVFGHRAGFNAGEIIIEAAFDKEIPYVTLWGCSVDNLIKRDSKEVAFLMEIFKKMFTNLGSSKKLIKQKIKIKVLGKWREMFPDDVITVAEEIIEKTKNNTGPTLTLLMAYNGNEEMLTAIKRLCQSSDPITSESLKSKLYTKDLPPVDLVVRTGGDPHLSNGFMMWDIQDAELYFTDKMWPDFSPHELGNALAFYETAGRRLGK